MTRDSNESLIDQIVRSVAARIDDKVLRSGARMPSIRQFAATHGVSAFTVVASYDRLVAKGYVESRRGAGFFVRERSPLNLGERSAHAPARQAAPPRTRAARCGLADPQHVPPGCRTSTSRRRACCRRTGSTARLCQRAARHQPPEPAPLLNYGTPQGFLPLRQQLQLKLAELEIDAPRRSRS